MDFLERKRLLLFGLPWTFTKYRVTDELITIDSGLLRKTEDDAYLYKMIDVRLEQSFLERLFGLGTVHCYSSDVTSPALKLSHIKHAKEIKDFILKQSEEERIRRKTLHTQSLDGNPMSAVFGQYDSGTPVPPPPVNNPF